MYTNQLSNICNEVTMELNICSFTKDMPLYKYFSIFSSQICSVVICKEIFEILRTSVMAWTCWDSDDCKQGSDKVFS